MATTSRSLHAITRDLSPALTRCELTHLAREPIDYARAVAQHDAYRALLLAQGIEVTRLPAEPELPDAVFVEDTAVVLDELAVITLPGAVSRRPEVTSVADALSGWRPIAHIQAPGTLDGGDVLRIGRTLYVGLSTRSNAEGAKQLCHLVSAFGYRVETLTVQGCLHLKSAVTAVTDARLLINPAWCDRNVFGAVECVEVDPAEPFGANVLQLADSVVIGAAYPRTAERLRVRGVTVHTQDLSELAKAEGAVTCCCLLFSV